MKKFWIALGALAIIATIPVVLLAQYNRINSSGTLPTCVGTGGIYIKTGASEGLYICRTGTWVGPFSTSTGTVTPSSTDVFTNKTIDAEGTGNVLTLRRPLKFVVGLCQNVTATLGWSLPASNAMTAVCVSGTNTTFGSASAADSATSSMQQLFPLGSSFTGTVDATLWWHTSATTGSVVLQVATVCVAVGETLDAAFSTASTVTDAAQGTANRANTATITSVTITGCGVDELMIWRVLRDATHASDDLAAAAIIDAIELTIREAL